MSLIKVPKIMGNLSHALVLEIVVPKNRVEADNPGISFGGETYIGVKNPFQLTLRAEGFSCEIGDGDIAILFRQVVRDSRNVGIIQIGDPPSEELIHYLYPVDIGFRFHNPI